MLDTLLKFGITLALGFAAISLARPYIGQAAFEVKQAVAPVPEKPTAKVTLRGDVATPAPTVQSVYTPEVSLIPRLYVDKIGIDAEIFEGKGEDTLLKGVWHLPHTSTPDKGGNTVLTAHRYMETSGPKTFYLLNKIEVGDEITVHWKGKVYVYEVFEIFIAKPNRLDVEHNTADPILTLYTCTPLWSSTDRIVVKAALQFSTN